MSTSLAGPGPPPTFPPSRSPLRKPLPTAYAQPVSHYQPAPTSVPDRRQSSLPQALPPTPPPPRHSLPAHSRSPSSNTFSSTPPARHSPPSSSAMAYQNYGNNNYPPTARRTLSNATTSTSSTSGRKASFAGTTLTRTTSSRSSGSSSSYVALMRRQKATVWSDRAQHEDPRLVAQQRAAKMRAAMEVSGAHPGRGATSAATSMTGGVRAKIRTHGVPKAQQYNPMAHPASGVPMRLSAREVEDDDYDDDHLGVRGGAHQRTGSGRSSAGSAGGRLSYGPSPGAANGGTVQNGSQPQTRGSIASTLDPQRARADTQSTIRSEGASEPTPVPDNFRGSDYFSSKTGAQNADPNSEASENDFGQVGGLPRRIKNLALEEKTAEDLQRRGSVDERTTTMRGYGRLFVANPDLSD